jgi:hypothetical protein
VRAAVCVAFDRDDCCISYEKQGNLCEELVSRESLSAAIQGLNKQGADAIAVISECDYQLLKVKSPSVSETEMKEALLWQEQAKFILPVNQLVIEYVKCKKSIDRDMLHLIAVAKKPLKANYDTMTLSALKLNKIIIPELVYANYVETHYPEKGAVVWLNFFEDCAQALLFNEGDWVASLRLPELEKGELKAMIAPLQLFYQEQVAVLSKEVLWLVNGPAFEGEIEQLNSLPGEVKKMNSVKEAASEASKLNRAVISHAIYGAMVEL